MPSSAAERVAERTRIFRRHRRRKQLHQLLIDIQDRLLVGSGIDSQLLVDKIRAHRFGKGGQIEVGQHDDPGVQRGDQHHGSAHAGARAAFFDDLIPAVVEAGDAQSIIEAGRFADRRQLGEAQLGHHVALEDLLHAFGREHLRPAVAALVEQHLHPMRHIRRCRGGRAGRAHGILDVARDQPDLIVDQGVRGGGVGILEVMARGARARHIQRRVQALLNQLVPRYTGNARGDLAGQKDARVLYWATSRRL